MNIYLVFLLIFAIIVFSNFMMFAAARSSRGTKINWLNRSKDAFGEPFEKENKQLGELHQQVKALSQDDNEGDA